MHRDRKVTKQNDTKRNILKKAIKVHRVSKTAKTLQKVFALLDRSVKTNLVHKNKAARLKSRLSKLIAAK